MTRIARGAVLEGPGGARSARRARVLEPSDSPLVDVEVVVGAARAREAVLSVARAIATRLVGDAVASDDRALAALFDEALGALGASTGLVATLAPSDAARLAPLLARVGARVLTEPTRAPGSITLESERGRVELTVEDAVRRLAAAVEPR